MSQVAAATDREKEATEWSHFTKTQMETVESHGIMGKIQCKISLGG